VECETKSDTSNKRDDWNLCKITHRYLSNITGKHEIKELQKLAILGIAHIFVLWKVLMLKYKTYFTGEITLHVEQTVNTEQLQHCTP